MLKKKIVKKKTRVTTLKAMADNTRLSVIEMLIKGKVGVSEMIKTLKCEPTLLSHHLSILKEEGIAESKRNGKNCSYSLTKEAKSKNGIKLNGIRITFC